MLELLESLAIVILMVPVVMAIILGLIYLLGELFNIISKFGQPKQRRQPSDDVKPASRQ
ncbi:MAG: AcrZ family multidrug efflux pump-associated protein [Sodalis sp. (in: enterobacteria)]|uniref:AcrZ family multidrug efflux pump-associated protein n=1 Tax=Sodalis sp. (in: enterobacteria) TaxID=1898979 RepID=UPI0039E6A3B6